MNKYRIIMINKCIYIYYSIHIPGGLDAMLHLHLHDFVDTTEILIMKQPPTVQDTPIYCRLVRIQFRIPKPRKTNSSRIEDTLAALLEFHPAMVLCGVLDGLVALLLKMARVGTLEAPWFLPHEAAQSNTNQSSFLHLSSC